MADKRVHPTDVEQSTGRHQGLPQTRCPPAPPVPGLHVMPIHLKCQSILNVSKSSSNDDDLLTVLVFALYILQLSIEGLSVVYGLMQSG